MLEIKPQTILGKERREMKFHYNEKYFQRHYSAPFYRRYIAVRNKFIRKEITKLVSSGKFLEIGFGGDNLIKFFKDNFDVFGVDVSKWAVKKIRGKYKPSNFKVCDVSKEKIPFEEKFDAICAINVVEHLENPEFALQNIFDSLARSGIFVIYLPIQSNILSKIQYKILYDVKEHIFRPSVKSLHNLLKKSGFKLYKEFAASFTPFEISNKFVLKSFNLYLGFWKKL